MHDRLKPLSYNLPILNMVVYKDARIAVLGLFIGDTPVSSILDYLGSGSVISSYSGSGKRDAALPSTPGSLIAWAYSFKTLDVVSRLF
jgi:hypothetical protein